MPEKQNIEWKSRWKDEYLEWICGFANAQGGRIYIGCDDNGNIRINGSLALTQKSGFSRRMPIFVIRMKFMVPY